MGVRRSHRPRLVVCCSLALVPFFGGCGVYDAPKPSVQFQNMTDERMTISIEGTEIPTVVGVPPNGQGNEVTMGRCQGTAIVVETEEGEPIGRVEKPACPGWLLTINEDYSLTYEEDKED